jgi:thiamine biosynthesis lipoprotein
MWVPGNAQKHSFSKQLLLMGSAFEIIVVVDLSEKIFAEEQINVAIHEIERIERLISSWDQNSQTSLINENAGIKAVTVDQELFDLIERSIKVSKLTYGAFDISYASIDEVWYFDGSMKALPSEESIQKSVVKIDYNNIILDQDKLTVFLKERGMRIGFGAIGKGYAAQKAKELLIENGVEDGVINASGDLVAWGFNADGKSWRVGIADPANNKSILAWIPVNDLAVVTSGNYEKFIEINGVRYSHIIDPRTGWPSRGLKSVTIICPNPELADALATALFVMGGETGLDLIDQLNGIECILVDEENKLIISKNIQLNYSKENVNFKAGK